VTTYPQYPHVVDLCDELPPKTYVEAQAEDGRLVISISAPPGTVIEIDINDGDSPNAESIVTRAR
jgi:hypothetical protein